MNVFAQFCKQVVDKDHFKPVFFLFNYFIYFCVGGYASWILFQKYIECLKVFLYPNLVQIGIFIREMWQKNLHLLILYALICIIGIVSRSEIASRAMIAFKDASVWLYILNAHSSLPTIWYLLFNGYFLYDGVFHSWGM